MANQREIESLAVIQNDIGYIKRDVADIKTTVQNSYVTKDEFEPIQKIVYGLVGLVLIAVAGGLISLVVRK